MVGKVDELEVELRTWTATHLLEELKNKMQRRLNYPKPITNDVISLHLVPVRAVCASLGGPAAAVVRLGAPGFCPKTSPAAVSASSRSSPNPRHAHPYRHTTRSATLRPVLFQCP